ncbi:MAG: metalloprotease family protein [archaeon]|nr:metalloprotease family protein [archaeon]
MKFSPAIVFFPGMILHELAHYFACVLLNVKVHKVKLFDLESAFVVHDKAVAWKAVIITLAPFFLNNFLGLSILSIAFQFLSTNPLISLILIWLAVSLFYFCFSSLQDAKNAFNSSIEFYDDHIFKKGNILEKIFWLATFPFIFIPLIIVLAFMLAFHYSFALRILWIIFLLFFSLNPSSALSVVSALNNLIVQIFSSFF